MLLYPTFPEMTLLVTASKLCRRYTVLSYAGEGIEGPENGTNGSNGSNGSSSRKSGGSAKVKLSKAKNNGKSSGGGGDTGPAFRHLPLSDSTLLVWVYRFDRDDPYRSIPNEAALQFAPPTAKPAADQQALDVEAIGRRSGAGAVGVQGGARDTGLLAWLWGGEKGGGGGVGGGGEGGVRQHFIGSAAWQGPSSKDGEQGREAEDEDIQRAIALSLAVESRTGDGRGVEESQG